MSALLSSVAWWSVRIATLLLAGCASYRELPLPTQAALSHDAAHLWVDANAMPTPSLRSHRFDPEDGLDMTEVAMLAVAHNPELQTLRAEGGVARAQAFAAGLLPDPQLTFARDRPVAAPAGSTVALTAGLSFDVGALLARSSLGAAANDESRQSDLNLLWQEWQTVARARLLFVKLDALAQSSALLGQQQGTLRARVDRVWIAVARGLIGADAASPTVAALQEVDRQRDDVERQVNQGRHDLNALLGVAPALRLTLVGPADVSLPGDAEVQHALAIAARRRPDLLALQAGYAAQDDRYRGALRAQFPAITLGPTRARDTSDINTIGLSLGITLPIFNRNRGQIAIESATRDRLRVEYQQRLDETVSDSHRLRAEEEILLRQRNGIEVSIAELASLAARVESAFTARNVDALTLGNVEAALLAKRLERIAVEQALREDTIALAALLGSELMGDEPIGPDKHPRASS